MQDSRLLHLNVECAERHSKRQRRIAVFVSFPRILLYGCLTGAGVLPARWRRAHNTGILHAQMLALRMASSVFPIRIWRYEPNPTGLRQFIEAWSEIQ